MDEWAFQGQRHAWWSRSNHRSHAHREYRYTDASIEQQMRCMAVQCSAVQVIIDDACMHAAKLSGVAKGERPVPWAYIRDYDLVRWIVVHRDAFRQPKTTAAREGSSGRMGTAKSAEAKRLEQHTHGLTLGPQRPTHQPPRPTNDLRWASALVLLWNKSDSRGCFFSKIEPIQTKLKFMKGGSIFKFSKNNSMSSVQWVVNI
jgi:hypothetical protein